MKEGGLIRVLDMQVAIACLQPRSSMYAGRIIAEGKSLVELMEIAKENEELERDREYFNGAHLGTIIEHEDYPATKDEVQVFPVESMDFIRAY